MRINITLGHNASAAIFDNGGNCVRAYEEERLTKVKSDSSFPKLAIEKCLGDIPPQSINYIGLSHWFDNIMDCKYYQPKYLEGRFVNAVIEHMSHHNAHAKSVWNFSGTDRGLTLVIDGFGNNEEVISIYKNGGLIRKIVGYEHSLGLMYQYATSAAGLKENEDEFKLLGYEIHSKIEPYILPNIGNLDIPSNSSELINYDKLKMVKLWWHDMFRDMSREDIARLAQYTLEQKVLEIVKNYIGDSDLVQLSGGVFYNVKLNNTIMRSLPNKCKLIVNPVCGDQGNVFGTHRCRYKDLYLGERNIDEIRPTHNDITEVFMGNMEFGPRALCNTSTLAMPTLDNVSLINTYNDRDTMMPMAPVVTRDFFLENFKDTNKVFKSEKFMIVSFDYKAIKEEWKGAAHYDPDRDIYTGRVQVLDEGDELYDYIKGRGGMMINTSLNYHGTPIIFDNDDYMIYKYKKSI